VFSNGLITCTPTPTNPGSCSVNGAGVLVPGSIPFSLTTKTVFNIPINDLTSRLTSGGQVNVTAFQTPEPVTLGLLGVGLLGLAASRRRARK
jgi:hypothetical protein